MLNALEFVVSFVTVPLPPGSSLPLAVSHTFLSYAAISLGEQPAPAENGLAHDGKDGITEVIAS